MKFEAELERLSPGSLPEGLISRMEAAMEGWEEVSDKVTEEIDKVVPFPPREDPDSESNPRRRTSIWAAAAGVALLGAVAGVLFTGSATKDSQAKSNGGPASAVRDVAFAPQAAKRTILNSSNQDVIIANGGKPLRVHRLNYVDRLVFRNPATGEEVHVEVPAVNYRLIPVATD